jgi:hypothetical protein
MFGNNIIYQKGIYLLRFCILIICMGITGCNTTTNEIKGSDLSPEEGMIITGFTGEAIYNAIPQRGRSVVRAVHLLRKNSCLPGANLVPKQ